MRLSPRVLATALPPELGGVDKEWPEKAHLSWSCDLKGKKKRERERVNREIGKKREEKKKCCF